MFYVFLEENKAKLFWSRKARAWVSVLSADCAYHTSQGAARRMNAYERERRQARQYGEFAFGFSLFPRA